MLIWCEYITEISVVQYAEFTYFKILPNLSSLNTRWSALKIVAVYKEFPWTYVFCVSRDTSFEVCHPRCVFKLHGEVNSVKKHSYKVWLNDGVY